MKKILGGVALALLLTGCGSGNNDSSSNGANSDEALRIRDVAIIQAALNDTNYNPSQAEIDCVRALGDVPDYSQKVRDCVNNN